MTLIMSSTRFLPTGPTSPGYLFCATRLDKQIGRGFLGRHTMTWSFPGLCL